MTMASDPARDVRRAELRQRYATWLHADVVALQRERAATFRRLIPGCAAGLAVIVLVGAALFAPGWPAGWWADPLSLARIAVAIGGTWWIARTFFVFTPDADDMALTSQDVRLDALVRRWVAQVRPGATYEPSEQLDAKWPQVARLVDGNRTHSNSVFAWHQDGVDVRVAEGSVAQSPPPGRGTGDDDSEMRFRGWVAVATVPRALKAAVRVRARGSERVDTCDDERFQPVEMAALTPAYDVRATEPAVTARILARAVPRLQAEARLGRHVHVGVAGRSIVVLLETADTWSHRLHATFGESHALVLGETLDLMHALIDALEVDRDR
jgi:hypothetical protein